MRKKIIGTLMATFLLTGCDLLKEEGTLNLETMESIDIYVDNEFKTAAGTSTKLILKEGMHVIKVHGISEDGDWEYTAEEEIEIGGKVEKTISIMPERSPTEQKIRKDKEELAEIEKEKEMLLSVAKDNGCNSYEDYLLALQNKEGLADAKTKLDVAEQIKSKYMNDSGLYMIPNEYITFDSFSFDKKTGAFSIKVNNISNKELTHFKVDLEFFDENFERIAFTWQSESVSIKAGESSAIKFNVSANGRSDIHRDIQKADKINLVLKVKMLSMNDKFGEINKHYEGRDERMDEISRYVLSEQTNRIKERILFIENKIKERCSSMKY